MNSNAQMFSIIIPLFNKENHIAKCIRSVLAQTYEKFEIIIVDDCSTDSSYAIIESFDVDARVRLIKNRENLGVGTSRNIGIDASAGDFLLFLDADDEITNNMLLSEISSYITLHDCKYITLTRDYQTTIKPNINNVINYVEELNPDFFRIASKESFAIDGNYPFGGSASAVVAKEIIGNSRFIEDRIVFEDYLFFVPLFLQFEAYYFCKISILINKTNNSLSITNRSRPIFKLKHPLYNYLKLNDFSTLRKDFFWRYSLEYISTHNSFQSKLLMIFLFSIMMVFNAGEGVDLRKKLYKIKSEIFKRSGGQNENHQLSDPS